MAAFRTAEDVYRVCRPKPKPLLQGRRQLIRHGVLMYFSPNTRSKKPRYFFLFDDVLLLTKAGYGPRDGIYWLKIYVNLRRGISIERDSDTQFRMLIPQPTGIRTFTFWARDPREKAYWLRDLEHLLWIIHGREGNDPSQDIRIPDREHDGDWGGSRDRGPGRERRRAPEPYDSHLGRDSPYGGERGRDLHEVGRSRDPYDNGGGGGRDPYGRHGGGRRDPYGGPGGYGYDRRDPYGGPGAYGNYHHNSSGGKGPKPVSYAIGVGKGVGGKVGTLGGKVKTGGSAIGSKVIGGGAAVGSKVKEGGSGIGHKVKKSGVPGKVKDSVAKVPGAAAKVPGAAIGGGSKIKRRVTGAGKSHWHDDPYARGPYGTGYGGRYGDPGYYGDRRGGGYGDDHFGRRSPPPRGPRYGDDFGPPRGDYDDRFGPRRGDYSPPPPGDRAYDRGHDERRGGSARHRDSRERGKSSKGSQKKKGGPKRRPGLIGADDYFEGYNFDSAKERSLFEDTGEDDFFSPREKDAKYAFGERGATSTSKQASRSHGWEHDDPPRRQSSAHSFDLSGSEDIDSDEEWNFESSAGGSAGAFGGDVLFIAPPSSKYSRDASAHSARSSTRTASQTNDHQPRHQASKETRPHSARRTSSPGSAAGITDGLLLLDLSTPVKPPVLTTTTSTSTAEASNSPFHFAHSQSGTAAPGGASVGPLARQSSAPSGLYHSPSAGGYTAQTSGSPYGAPVHTTPGAGATGSAYPYGGGTTAPVGHSLSAGTLTTSGLFADAAPSPHHSSTAAPAPSHLSVGATTTSPFGLTLDIANVGATGGGAGGSATSPRLVDLSRLSPQEFAQFTSHGFSAQGSAVGGQSTQASTSNPFGLRQ